MNALMVLRVALKALRINKLRTQLIGRPLQIITALKRGTCISRISKMRLVVNPGLLLFLLHFAVKIAHHAFKFRNHGFDLRLLAHHSPVHL